MIEILHNVVDTQAKGAWMKLQWKYRVLLLKRFRSVSETPWISIKLNFHTHQCDQWCYFQFKVGAITITALTKGERSDNCHIADLPGLNLELRWNQRNRFLNLPTFKVQL